MAEPDTRYQKPFVQMKREWTDAWRTELELEVDQWDNAAGPARPQAQISYKHGKISDGRGPEEDIEPLLSERVGWFVRIMRPVTDKQIDEAPGILVEPTPVWLGVLVRPKEQQGASDPGPTGNEMGRCLGLDFLLERTSISRSFFWDGAKVDLLGTSLPFNIRDSKTSTLQGNRTTDKHDGLDGRPESYMFSDTDGAVWSAQDIIEYLVAQFAPADLDMRVQGTANLNQYIDSWRPFPNIRAALNALANRTRGHSWEIVTTTSGVASPQDLDVPRVTIYATFPDFAEGGGISLAPNDDRVDIDTEDARLNATVNISDDQQPQFDILELLGDPLINMASLPLAASVQVLPAWSATLEAEYKLANDKGRATSKFETVYRAFVIDTSLLPEGPGFNDDGTLALTYEGRPATDVPQAHLGKKLLRNLPMLKTDDDIVGGVGVGPPEYRRPLLYTSLPDDPTEYVALDQIGLAFDNMGSVTYKMMNGSMGFILGKQRNGNHLYALNHFDTTDGDTTAAKVEPKIDYEDIVATIAWPSSERLRVKVEFSRDNTAGLPRTKVIEIPGAQAWWRQLGTTTDIVDGERVITTTGDVLRNDRERLNTIATFAKAWFEPERRTCSVQFKGIVDDYKVGQILRNVTGPHGSTTINTLISRVTYNAVKGTTIVQTAFSELDFARFAGQAVGAAGIRRQGLSFPNLPTIGAAYIGQEPENISAQDGAGDHQVIVERGSPTGAFTGGATITLNPVDMNDADIPGKPNVVCHLAPDKSSVTASYATNDVLAFSRYEGFDGEASGVLAGIVPGGGGGAAVTGTIVEWGGAIATIPSGYIFCDGTAVSRTTYAALFSAIGTRHGVGNGSTTFNLPDRVDNYLVGAKQDDSGVPKTNINGTLEAAITGSIDHIHDTHPPHDPPVLWTAGPDDQFWLFDGSPDLTHSVHSTENHLPPSKAAVWMIKT